MNISKNDAVAFLAKWKDEDTSVRGLYSTVTGNATIVGKVTDLSASAIKIMGNGCEMLLYFRGTSTYDYKDARETATQANKDRTNRYPTVIDIRFSNGDRVEIVESFSE